LQTLGFNWLPNQELNVEHIGDILEAALGVVFICESVKKPFLRYPECGIGQIRPILEKVFRVFGCDRGMKLTSCPIPGHAVAMDLDYDNLCKKWALSARDSGSSAPGLLLSRYSGVWGDAPHPPSSESGDEDDEADSFILRDDEGNVLSSSATDVDPSSSAGEVASGSRRQPSGTAAGSRESSPSASTRYDLQSALESEVGRILQGAASTLSGTAWSRATSEAGDSEADEATDPRGPDPLWRPEMKAKWSKLFEVERKEVPDAQMKAFQSERSSWTVSYNQLCKTQKPPVAPTLHVGDFFFTNPAIRLRAWKYPYSEGVPIRMPWEAPTARARLGPVLAVDYTPRFVGVKIRDQGMTFWVNVWTPINNWGQFGSANGTWYISRDKTFP
jgi:hypothetical protein